jgi:hypothetical protein
VPPARAVLAASVATLALVAQPTAAGAHAGSSREAAGGNCNVNEVFGQSGGVNEGPTLCQGGGVVSIGPEYGEDVSMIGPTITGPAAVTVVQADGPVAGAF